jgi:excisionase family DNA binding protein
LAWEVTPSTKGFGVAVLRATTPKKGSLDVSRKARPRPRVGDFSLSFSLFYDDLRLVSQQTFKGRDTPPILADKIIELVKSVLRRKRNRPTFVVGFHIEWQSERAEFERAEWEQHGMSQAAIDSGVPDQFTLVELRSILQKLAPEFHGRLFYRRVEFACGGYLVRIEPDERLIARGIKAAEEFVARLTRDEKIQLATLVAESYQRTTGEPAAFVTFSTVLTQLLGVEEASEKLKRSRNRVTSYAKEGILPAVRLGERHYLFFKKHLDEFAPLKKGPKGPRERRNGD